MAPEDKAYVKIGWTNASVEERLQTLRGDPRYQFLSVVLTTLPRCDNAHEAILHGLFSALRIPETELFLYTDALRALVEAIVDSPEGVRNGFCACGRLKGVRHPTLQRVRNSDPTLIANAPVPIFFPSRHSRKGPYPGYFET